MDKMVMAFVRAPIDTREEAMFLDYLWLLVKHERKEHARNKPVYS